MMEETVHRSQITRNPKVKRSRQFTNYTVNDTMIHILEGRQKHQNHRNQMYTLQKCSNYDTCTNKESFPPGRRGREMYTDVTCKNVKFCYLGCTWMRIYVREGACRHGPVKARITSRGFFQKSLTSSFWDSVSHWDLSFGFCQAGQPERPRVLSVSDDLAVLLSTKPRFWHELLGLCAYMTGTLPTAIIPGSWVWGFYAFYVN